MTNQLPTHGHGIHGSDKGVCLYCGSTEDESKYCAERDREAKKEKKRQDASKKLAKVARSKLSKEEFDALHEAIRNYWIYT